MPKLKALQVTGHLDAPKISNSRVHVEKFAKHHGQRSISAKVAGKNYRLNSDTELSAYICDNFGAIVFGMRNVLVRLLQAKNGNGAHAGQESLMRRLKKACRRGSDEILFEDFVNSKGNPLKKTDGLWNALAQVLKEEQVVKELCRNTVEEDVVMKKIEDDTILRAWKAARGK